MNDWAEFRKSAADLYDSFIGLAEEVEHMAPHRLREHEMRRAQFIERQCLAMADVVVDLTGPERP